MIEESRSDTQKISMKL